VQSTQVVKQRRFGDRPQIQHGATSADPPRETRGPEDDHVAVHRRMHFRSGEIGAQISQCRFDGAIAARRRESDRLPVQTDDPHQHMRQHRTPQSDPLGTGAHHRGLDQQIGFQRGRSFDQTEHADVLAAGAIRGHHDMRKRGQVGPAAHARWRAVVGQIGEHHPPVDARQLPPILQIR